MPIYEFACGNCGTNFEKRVSFSATVAPPCESCGSEDVQRLLSAPAIHFKGSGWYITDSKKAENGKSNGKESTDSKDTGTVGDADAKGTEKKETEAKSDSASSTSTTKESSEPSSTKASSGKKTAA